MKICIINNTPIDPDFHQILLGLLNDSLNNCLQPDTTITLRGINRGTRGDQQRMHDYRNSYFQLLSTQAIVEATLQAEQEQFDAVVVNCFDDPGVKEARAVVSIPVIGIGEASLLFGCQVGRKLGIVVPNMPGQIAFVEEQLRYHGLTNRLSQQGIIHGDTPFAEAWVKGLEDCQYTAADIRTLGTELIQRGADAIIVACGGLSLLCGAARLHSIEHNEQAFPVIVPLTVALKQAEVMVSLQQQLSMPVQGNIRGSHRFDQGDLERVHSAFET